MSRKRIGILGFEGVVGIDLFGAAQVFAGVEIGDGQGNVQAAYDVLTIGLSTRPFATDSGITVKPRKTLNNSPSLDTFIIPGGKALRCNPQVARSVAEFVLERVGNTRRVASICTGAFALAETGLLR